MSTASNNAMTLEQRLEGVQALQDELVRKMAGLMAIGDAASYADLFVLGGIRRILAQIRGFCDLIRSKNFPCAAGIFRMQLDTALRIFGLSLMEDRHASCERIMDGGKYDKEKDREGKRLTDSNIREKLEADHPWITAVYHGSSGFVHLSERHIYNSIHSLNEESRLVYFMISDTDPPRPDETYFEIVDNFFEATKLAATMALGYLAARAQQRYVANGETPQNG